MNIGTKSILFGAHQFALHPWFVAAAWWKLFGFPLDPRLWMAFWLHDLGYWGKPNMDGAEGERHPEFGAKIMSVFGHEWRGLVLYHSRFYARRDGVAPSRLCAADKLAISLTPWWLYLPAARATGELAEYRRLHDEAKRGHGKYAGDKFTNPNFATSDKGWYQRVQDYCRRWAYEHRDGRADTWTAPAAPERKTT